MDINKATAWLADYKAAEPFMPRAQARTVADFARRSEERDHFREKLAELRETVAGVPALYATDGDAAKLAKLHYFAPAGDWWIFELDPETREGFGFVCLAGMSDCAELGYVSLPELFEAVPFLELDLYYTPRTLAELKAKVGA